MARKILHIITRLDRGGSSEDTLLNCLHAAAQGEEPVIVHGASRNPSEPLYSAARAAGIRFIEVPALTRAIHPVRDLTALYRICRIIRAERPAIVHTHTSKAGIIGRWAAWFARCCRGPHAAILHATHGHIFYGYYHPVISYCFILIERCTACITDRIIVLTDREITEHRERGIGRKEQFAVIHSGIDFSAAVPSTTTIRQQLGIADTDIVVGSAGRLDPVKGYRYLVAAAQHIHNRVPDEKLRYLIIGDGPERDLLERMACAAGLVDAFVCVGWQESSDAFIACMDIYVQPSLNEGMGKAVAQAQRLGKPVIASNVQGLAALITHEDNGLLVPPQDAASLASAILALARNSGLRRTLGEHARQRAHEKADGSPWYRLSIEYMHVLLDDLYRSFP